MACSSDNSVKCASNVGKCKLATYSSIFFGNKYTSDLYRPGGALNNSISANACVADVTDTTNDGILEHDKFTKRPSANKISRFPSGHIM